MNNPRRLVTLGLVALTALAAPAAWAGEPTDQLRGGIDRVIALLGAPAATRDGHAGITRAASGMFDFTEMAQRALGSYWPQRTPAERQEFAALFAELLQRSWTSKIEQFGGERISYAGETVDGDRAVVKTTILTRQGSQVPVDYRLGQHEGQWRVYDVVIEGVSLVTNYRTQFANVIQKSSYEELVRKLRAARDQAVPGGPSRPAS